MAILSLQNRITQALTVLYILITLNHFLNCQELAVDIEDTRRSGSLGVAPLISVAIIPPQFSRASLWRGTGPLLSRGRSSSFKGVALRARHWVPSLSLSLLLLQGCGTSGATLCPFAVAVIAPPSKLWHFGRDTVSLVDAVMAPPSRVWHFGRDPVSLRCRGHCSPFKSVAFGRDTVSLQRLRTLLPHTETIR